MNLHKTIRELGITDISISKDSIEVFCGIGEWKPLCECGKIKEQKTEKRKTLTHINKRTYWICTCGSKKIFKGSFSISKGFLEEFRKGLKL